ncbi:MAG: hypothetical protein CEE43_12895 [Promethearchaeota archaeon Loki_b32]|nr:MAG: hypothetical protein CEE43_12895 [Candidatus Lokiarchaeota archaeon Loki_b32]
MYQSFPYVYSEKKPQSQFYLMDLVSFLQIILKRIDAAKEKYGQTLVSDVRESIKHLQYLKLDVRSLYLFSSAFLDYLVNYISHSFFQDYVKSGLKNNSFRDHIKTLKKTEGVDELFIEYKNFLLKKEQILELRIIIIRDKMITHRYTDTNEFWGYDPRTKTFYIYFTKQRDFYIIKEALRVNIQILAQKYNVVKEFNPELVSEFVYYNSILEELENLPVTFEKKDRDLLKNSRIALGAIINGEKVYNLLYETSEGLCKILNKDGLRYVPRYME